MLQRLPADAPPTFATLNPPRPPAAEKTIRRLQLAHPTFSYAAHEAQQKLHTVQVAPTTSFIRRIRSCSQGAAQHLCYFPTSMVPLLINENRCGLALSRVLLQHRARILCTTPGRGAATASMKMA